MARQVNWDAASVFAGISYTVEMKAYIAPLLWSCLLPAICCAQAGGDEPLTADTEDASKPVASSIDPINKQLADSLPDQASVLWLDVAGEKFLALYLPALRAKPLGTVIMLPAEGQHPAWPGTLNELRKQLPLWGWNTLSIALPDPISPTSASAPPSAVDGMETAPPPTEVLDETEEIFDSTAQGVTDGSLVPPKKTRSAPTSKAEGLAVERLVAAVNYVNQQDRGKIVIYGQGLGALRAGRYWQETGDNRVAGFIFVDAINGQSKSDFNLPKALNNPSLPILDIINNRTLTTELDGKQRAEQAAIYALDSYQQNWFANDGEQLANTVRGFLRRHFH